MKANRWQQIENLYHAARERREEERQRFLDEACREDSALREEVESLLVHEAEAVEFLEVPEQRFREAENITVLRRIRLWLERKFFSNARKQRRDSGFS